MIHLKVLVCLASLLVAYASCASLSPLRGHDFLDHEATDSLKRSLEDRLRTHELVLRKRSLLDTEIGARGKVHFDEPQPIGFHSIGKRSSKLNAPRSIDLHETVKVLAKRSSEPVAPYRGHNFRRNSLVRQRPIRTRSRFYRTRGNPNRVSSSG